MAYQQERMDTTDGAGDTLVDKIVGTDCEIRRIIIKLKPVELSLNKYWKQLSKHLATPPVIVKKHDQNLLLSLECTMDVVEDLIQDWKMKNASSATLKGLIRHCRSSDLEDAAVLLEKLLEELQNNVDVGYQLC